MGNKTFSNKGILISAIEDANPKNLLKLTDGKPARIYKFIKNVTKKKHNCPKITP